MQAAHPCDTPLSAHQLHRAIEAVDILIPVGGDALHKAKLGKRHNMDEFYPRVRVRPPTGWLLAATYSGSGGILFPEVVHYQERQHSDAERQKTVPKDALQTSVSTADQSSLSSSTDTTSLTRASSSPTLKLSTSTISLNPVDDEDRGSDSDSDSDEDAAATTLTFKDSLNRVVEVCKFYRP